MKLVIIPDKYGSQSYSNKWCEFLKERGIQVKFIHFTDYDFLEQIKMSGGLMWRPATNPDDKQKARRLLFLLNEYLNIPVFPDWYTYWHYDDKISQYYLFQTLDIATPKTWVFWDKDEALTWVKNANYPLVHKLAAGASSNHVKLIRSPLEASMQIIKDFEGYLPGKASPFKTGFTKNAIFQYIKQIGEAFAFFQRGTYPPLPDHFWQPEKNYTYFQEFVPDNKFDTRVTIIGNRAFVFRRWNRENDFRASGSGKLDYSTVEINKQCILQAFEMSQKAQFQSMAYDFLFKQESPVISEISYTFSDQAIYDCPGYWDKNLDWHEGHLWPEEAQVIDFLQRINELHSK